MADKGHRVQTPEPISEGVQVMRIAPAQGQNASASADGQNIRARRQHAVAVPTPTMFQRFTGGVLPGWSSPRPESDQRARNQQLRVENDSLVEQLGKLQVENEKLQAQSETMKSDYQTLQAEDKKRQAHCSKLQAASAYHETGKREARKRSYELEKIQQRSAQHLQQLEQGRKDLQSENDELRTAQETTRKTQNSLKDQIVQYKKMISQTTRTEDQVSDDAIREEAGQLFFRIQDFAVKYFRGVRFDYRGLPDELKHWMRDYTPNARALPASSGIKVASTVISKAITSRSEVQFCFGSSREDLVQAATMLALLQPNSHADTKAWPEMTQKLLSRTNNDVLERAYNSLVCDMMMEVRFNLTHATNVEWEPTMDADLSKVFTSCLAFFRLLHRQSARFDVAVAPGVQADGRPRLFNPSYEEDINNEDDEELHDRAVEMSLFPAIIKWGDEYGKNLDSQTIVSKAKVVLRDNTRPLSSITRAQKAVSTAPVVGVHGGAQQVPEYYGTSCNESSLI